MLHVSPDLGEVPGLAGHDKQQLLFSVEQRRQQLESDIQQYIQRKQQELRSYEQELLGQYPPKDHVNRIEDHANKTADHAHKTEDVEAEDKRKKHSRVQKRERELWGLITPAFLPLMESPPTPKQREKKPRPSRDADQSREAPKPAADMSTPVEPARRSALRSNNTSRNKPRRRKRVSIVIDDQIVLPADTILAPSETTSASNSTASLDECIDECIDPRLTHVDALPPLAVHAVHTDAVHHSLPVTMHRSSSPIKSSHPLLPSAPMSLDSDSPPVHTPYESTPARIDDIPEDALYPPTHGSIDLDSHDNSNNSSIPQEEQDFSTYVGGIDGSGVSDLNQAGSYGYPSSLGASYLESYMMSRPLSVRMAAAEKAELGKEEKRAMLEKKDEEEEDFEMQGRMTERSGGSGGGSSSGGGAGRGGAGDDDDDFMGSMDDF